MTNVKATEQEMERMRQQLEIEQGQRNALEDYVLKLREELLNMVPEEEAIEIIGREGVVAGMWLVQSVLYCIIVIFKRDSRNVLIE